MVALTHGKMSAGFTLRETRAQDLVLGVKIPSSWAEARLKEVIVVETGRRTRLPRGSREGGSQTVVSHARRGMPKIADPIGKRPNLADAVRRGTPTKPGVVAT